MFKYLFFQAWLWKFSLLRNVSLLGECWSKQIKKPLKCVYRDSIIWFCTKHIECQCQCSYPFNYLNSKQGPFSDMNPGVIPNLKEIYLLQDKINTTIFGHQKRGKLCLLAEMYKGCLRAIFFNAPTEVNHSTILEDKLIYFCCRCILCYPSVRKRNK